MAELPAPKAGAAPALVIDGGSALFEATREFRAAEWGTVDRFLSLCEAKAPLPLQLATRARSSRSTRRS